MDNMRLTDSDMAELREAFFKQAGEMLDNLNGYILAIEKDNGEADWKSLKRSFHTLKGDSRAMGFNALGTFAHKVEDLIEAMKDRGPQRESFDLLFGCTDAVGGFVETIASGNEPDISDIASRIDAYINSATIQAEKPRKQAVPKGGDRGTALLRIEPQRIDKIMDLVGELVIGRSMLSQVNSEIDTLTKEAIASRLYNVNSSFERTLSELQKSVMKVRMLPVEVVFRRVPRIVRDLSAEKGKCIRLVIEGESTEIDKGIVDVIAEPLMHIVRNAIDHGIETPEERGADGKPREGMVRLSAFHQGNQIVIEVTDDGRGIDIERIKQKAVQEKIISEEDAEKIGLQEATNLIFSPGFSTSERVTEVSGRGIGMNIVKDVVESLRGVIDISSEKGAGTRFTIRLPLTLAIMKAILFGYKDERFALPLASITDIARISPKDIDSIGGRPAFRHRDRMVPLISVDGETSLSERSFIIFLAVAQMRAGLIAHRILGEEELVIKALDGAASRGIAAGASILGCGSVVLILDPLAMIKKSSFRREENTEKEGRPL